MKIEKRESIKVTVYMSMSTLKITMMMSRNIVMKRTNMALIISTWHQMKLKSLVLTNKARRTIMTMTIATMIMMMTRTTMMEMMTKTQVTGTMMKATLIQAKLKVLRRTQKSLKDAKTKNLEKEMEKTKKEVMMMMYQLMKWMS